MLSSLFPCRLSCNALDNPLAVQTPNPTLSWHLQAPEGYGGGQQTAYQVIVAASLEALLRGEGDYWDSGRTESGNSIHVAYAGRGLASGTECFWKVRIWDENRAISAWSEPASWRMGLLSADDWKASWITVPAAEAGGPVSLVRHNFKVRAVVHRATLHISALGVYEAYINGRKIGDQFMAPEWTDYSQRVQYQTYDVTDLVTNGVNAIGALLGDGWYCGRIGLAADVGYPIRAIYGPHPLLRAQLHLEYTDGSTQYVVTDQTWNGSLDGPIRSADILDGETYDARYAMEGWSEPDFDERGWSPVAIEAKPDIVLIAQSNEPIRITREIAPLSCLETRPGVYLFDLGQNMAGWCRFRIRAEHDTEIRFFYGEVLDESGQLYRANLRTAPQEDVYFACGGSHEVFEPRFTYHGFRYVEVAGLQYEPELSDVVGCVVHSDVKRSLEFQCSEPLLNQLWTMIDRTLCSNLHSTPTDCPQRDERLGWLGDAQIFCRTANHARSMDAFWTKWLLDVRDAQTSDGRFPDFAPHPFDPETRYSTNPGWADGGIMIPWNHWVSYGNRRVLEDHYEAASRWIAYVVRGNPDLVWRNFQYNFLIYGDWLNGDTLDLRDWPKEGGAVPLEVYATAFFAHSTRLLARMAEVLGKASGAVHYARLAESVRQAFNKAFVDSDGRILGDTQTGYALALHFDLLGESMRPQAFSHLVAAMEPYGGRPSTGIQGTLRLMMELSRGGRHDLAYAIATSREIPSWGYMLDHGGTTIWERWDGYVEGRGFQNKEMNSFNHCAIGAVGEWMVRTLLGLSPDESNPGYAHFFVAPQPGELTWAKGHYDSPRGRIEIDWQRDDEGLTLEIVVPPTATASVFIADNLMEWGETEALYSGTGFGNGQSTGGTCYEVSAGRHSFSHKKMFWNSGKSSE
jgi:alpha-L-rhamnosidase